MPSGHALMFAAIYASVVLYGLSLALMTAGRWSAARVTWSAGCALIVLHVGVALHVVHRWDHADLVRVTAEQTEAVTGVRAGGGVYVNYLFLAVWAADVAWWWYAGHARYRGRPAWLSLAVHAFLLFIVFNGTVVFASPPTRLLSLVGFAVLATVGGVQLLFRRRPALSHP